jgi:proteasome lid subunit RPN8/RPN11
MDESASLRMTAALLHELERNARSALPEECCGLLIGRQLTVALPESIAFELSAIVPSPNRAEPHERTQRFEIDPLLRLKLQRELRATDSKIIGVYHSHPGGGAELSATDKTRAEEENFIWLILAPQSGGGTASKAFLVRRSDKPHSFLPMELRIIV